MHRILDRFFRIAEQGGAVRTEVIGGATTFVTMAYIIVVNPAILENAGIPREPSTVATILAAALGCLLMGLYANRPFAVAPYMGENAFIAFSLSHILIDGQHITWQERLGTVFVSGAAFFVLTLLHIRTWLADAISSSMKHAFAVGIGLFLLLIGLYETGIVQSFVTGLPVPAMVSKADPNQLRKPDVPLKIGDFSDPTVLLALGGFALIALLILWRIRGAILLGIAGTALAGILLGHARAPDTWLAWPWDYDLGAIAGQLDIVNVLRLSFFSILLTLFLISFLDTLGTLFALGAAGDMLDDKGNLPDLEKPMIVDSVSCMASAWLGTSTSGAFIESATGIKEGARTGLAAVVTGVLFLAALFFIPLFSALQEMKFAYFPALMIVGLLMFQAARHLDFDDLTEMVPALVTIVMIVFTYNIANGLTAGLILHPLMKLAVGRWRSIHPGSAILAAMCLLYYVLGRPH